MKKITLLFMVLMLLTACNKEKKILENEYYTIIHDIIPIYKEYLEVSSKSVKDMYTNIVNDNTVNVDDTIKELNNIEQEYINKIESKGKDFKHELSKQYVQIKIKYIQTVSKNSIQALDIFKTKTEEDMQKNINDIAKMLGESMKEIENIIKEDERIMSEISKTVNK